MKVCLGSRTTRIDIAAVDAISDNGREIYNFLKQHGINTIFYMGVHTNMCSTGPSQSSR